MLGALIGAGASILGGIMGSSSKSRSDRLMAQQQRAALEQNERQYQESLRQRQEEMAKQEQFAKEGLRWRVQDAKAAGIHPLYAIGASVPTYSPTAIVSGSSYPMYTPSSGNPMGEALSKAGQDIGRAINATSTSQEKFTSAMSALQLERGALENTLLRSQIARLNTTSSPSFPSSGNNWLIEGQGDTSTVDGIVVDQAMKRTTGAPGALHSEPGAISDVGWARTATGLVPIPAKEIKERIEDNEIQEIAHFLRNNIIPTEPPFSPGPGRRWYFNGLEWRTTDRRFVPGGFRNETDYVSSPGRWSRY